MSKEIEDWLQKRTQELQRQPEAATEHVAPASTKRVAKYRLSALAKIILFAVVPAILLLGGALYVWQKNISHNPLPKAIQQTVTFKLYYPEKLPAGWKLDNSSIRSSGNVVLYSLRGPTGNVTITIQPRPDTFDYDSFYHQGLTDATQFNTPMGQATLGKSSGKLVGSLVANGSWILASPSTSHISQTDIQEILAHLKKS